MYSGALMFAYDSHYEFGVAVAPRPTWLAHRLYYSLSRPEVVAAYLLRAAR
jgi:hypothetical protein